MHLFYSTTILHNQIELDKDESRHLSKVLRLTNGDAVVVVDGEGNWYNCQIAEAHGKKALLNIIQQEDRLEEFNVEIASAPTKNLSRWEWFLEKSTEIGIDAIHPISTFHSERKVLKRERQERILVSAMKQSYKAKLPHLSDMQKLEEFIKLDFDGEKYIAHCEEGLPKMKLNSIHPKGKKALILIGPEGDFSKEEILAATAAGFRPISLGKSRLRTETAALVACHTIHLIHA